MARPPHLRRSKELEDDLALARRTFAAMGALDPYALSVLADGLRLTDSPARELATPLGYFASDLADEGAAGDLAVLSLAHALRTVAGQHPDLIERLAELDGPPWAPIREALISLIDRKAP